MMMLKSAAIAVAALGAAAAFTVPATAVDATPDSAGGRYMFNNTADGVVRLDTQSGQVSLCSQKGVSWVCEAAPEDRAVLENEIARLRAENAALKKEILARGLPLPPGAMPEPSTAQSSSTSQNSITVPLSLFGAGGYGLLVGRIGGPFLVVQAVAPVVLAYVVERASDDAGLMVVAAFAVVALACFAAIRPARTI